MDYCATWTLPDGEVACMRPNQQLVTALIQPTEAGVVDTARAFRLTCQRLLDYRSRMTALTAPEAVRVIAEHAVDEEGKHRGFLSSAVTDLTVHPATGLLDGSDEGLPARRRFRRCWRQVGGVVAVDMPSARGQRMAEVRRARNGRLATSDPEMLKARDQDDRAREAVLKEYRQQLRDLPATALAACEACVTPEELAAWEPTWPTL